MSGSFEVDVNPRIIKWARESAGYRIDEIANKLKTSVENYEKIEAGIKKPTFRQLELLSKYFNRPLSTFFLPEPPKEDLIVSSFRVLPKVQNLYSKEFYLALRKAHYYQSVARELTNAMGYNISAPINEYNLRNSPEKSAQIERENIGISIEKQLKWKNAYEAFNNWRRVIEEKNILVFQFKFPLEDARGFCLIDNPPVIVINSSDNILARIFTLLHEYAHILIGISEIYTEEIVIDKQIENWCNLFTAEFLIPARIVKETPDFEDIIKLKKDALQTLENLSSKYKVSKKALLVRLKTLDIIDDRQFEYFTKYIKDKPSEEKKVFFLTPEKKCVQEKGEKFISTVLEAKEKGIITTHEAMEYLSIKFKYISRIEKLLSPP